MTISIKPTASGSTIEQDGSQVLSIDSNQNVGIGTSSPSYKLDVTGSIGIKNNDAFYRGTSVAGNSVRLVGLAADDNVYVGSIDSLAGSNTIFRTNGTERMRINSNGVVTKPYQPAFVATNNGGTHTTNTSQTFDFNVQKFDKGNNYDPSTYRFTAPVAGVYYFNFHIFEQNATAVKSIMYKKNGSAFGYQDTALSYQGNVDIGQATIDGPVILDLAANDYVEVAVRNVASANITWYGGHSWFMGYLIG